MTKHLCYNSTIISTLEVVNDSSPPHYQLDISLCHASRFVHLTNLKYKLSTECLRHWHELHSLCSPLSGSFHEPQETSGMWRIPLDYVASELAEVLGCSSASTLLFGSKLYKSLLASCKPHQAPLVSSHPIFCHGYCPVAATLPSVAPNVNGNVDGRVSMTLWAFC